MGFGTRCDQLIDDENMIEWNHREYHEKCFACFGCQISLKTQMAYTNKTHEEFFCSTCINNKLPNRCFRCQKKNLDEKYDHESCFTCSSCNKSITNDIFYPKKNPLLCEMCHERTRDKCEFCKKRINNGHIIIFQDKKYHDTCMRCAKCVL